MHQGWALREHGPPQGEHCLLLLPGGLCTAKFYDDVASEITTGGPGLRLVAATPPGHGGTTPPKDVSFESYVRMASDLRRDLGCDVVVGHSLGANVAVEMACSQEFTGPLVLLSPSFSRQDESMSLRAMDRLASILGTLPFHVMLKLIGPGMSGLKVSDSRRAELVDEMRKNDARTVRLIVRSYLRYLDGQPSLARRLCQSGLPTWLAYGDHGDVGLTDDERTELLNCPTVTMVEVVGSGHMSLNEQPAQVATLIRRAVAAQRA